MAYNFKKQRLIKNVYGLGYSNLLFFSKQLGFNFRYTNLNIKDKSLRKLNIFIKKLTQNYQLKLKRSQFKEFYKKIRTYRGFRLIKGYPARGQRTHTNRKTAKKFR